jgi:hypothetical protein
MDLSQVAPDLPVSGPPVPCSTMEQLRERWATVTRAGCPGSRWPSPLQLSPCRHGPSFPPWRRSHQKKTRPAPPKTAPLPPSLPIRAGHGAVGRAGEGEVGAGSGAARGGRRVPRGDGAVQGGSTGRRRRAHGRRVQGQGGCSAGPVQLAVDLGGVDQGRRRPPLRIGPDAVAPMTPS